MSHTVSEKQPTRAGEKVQRQLQSIIHSCLLTWEIYPLLLVAGFLRLYRLDTTAFGSDQSVLFRLAYDAVHRGLIPITSNSSSIATMHLPLAIYFLMLPVLFSSDPLWAAVMTALFNIIAVLIAYIFTRRYYGRLAAIIASLLFATSDAVIVFSRFIWQPTLLGPFVILFLFALFWGAVERRKGWLFPALFLLGVMFQLHEITFLLAVPLLVVMLLVPQTICLRDVVLACISLLLIFAPYLLWEVTTKFADVYTALHLTRSHALIDDRAITFYGRFLSSYYYDDRFLHDTFYDPTGSEFSLVFRILPLLVWTREILTFLLIAGFATAGVLVLRSSGRAAVGAVPAKKQTGIIARLCSWWASLRANPFRCGLLVLLIWQIVPVLALTRHTANVHLHYLLMILPGPFILIGWFVAYMTSWLQKWKPAPLWRALRYGTYAVTALILSIQIGGSTFSVLDTANGINNHIFGYNAIGSLEHAVQEADQVAQQHHLNRVYISLSIPDDYDTTLTGLPLLAEQMHTPSTLFDSANCLVLPNPAAGPAVLLMSSSARLAATLLSRFATATLVDRPPILGTSPFQLYIVTASMPVPTTNGFTNHLQLLASQAQQVIIDTTSHLVTRWTLLHNEQSSSRTTYTYSMKVTTDLSQMTHLQTNCLLTSIRAGDQLVATFLLPRENMVPSSFKVTGKFLITSPFTISIGSLHFETFRTQGTPVALESIDGSGTVTITGIPVPGVELQRSFDVLSPRRILWPAGVMTYVRKHAAS